MLELDSDTAQIGVVDQLVEDPTEELAGIGGRRGLLGHATDQAMGIDPVAVHESMDGARNPVAERKHG